MKDEPWRGDPAARCLHLEKKLHNQAEEIARLETALKAGILDSMRVELHKMPPLQARLDRALALWKKHEWADTSDGEHPPECLVCKGVKPGYDPGYEGHAPDCKLAALLEETP